MDPGRMIDEAREAIDRALARMDRKLIPKARRAERAVAGEEPGDPWDGEDTTRRSLPEIEPKPALAPQPWRRASVWP